MDEIFAIITVCVIAQGFIIFGMILGFAIAQTLKGPSND
jgi:hypothetical protein